MSAALARAGRAVLVGMGPDEVPINVPLVQSRELTVTDPFAVLKPPRSP